MRVKMSNISVVRELVKSHKSGVKGLAEFLGVTRSAVYSIIDRNKTDTETLVKLCQFFDCDLNTFFTFEEGTESNKILKEPPVQGYSTKATDYKERYLELLEQNYTLLQRHYEELKKT